MTKEARIYNGKKTVSSINDTGKTGQLHAKDSNLTTLTPYTKINSKWIKYLHVGPETIKLLEENLGNILFDISLSNILFGSVSSGWEMKAKINKWDYLKLKSCFTAKETINKMRRQPTDWEKIFANDMTNKELISKI